MAFLLRTRPARMPASTMLVSRRTVDLCRLRSSMCPGGSCLCRAA